MNDMKEKAMGAVKAFLERKGYEVVDEAWQGPEGIGGIDLVAVDEDGTLVFVDATVRIGTDGFPEAHRARGLREALAAMWLAGNGDDYADTPVRFDEVAMMVWGIYGAPETFERLRALGVRTSRRRVARIMRERGWRGAARVRQAAVRREARFQAGVPGRPGQAQVRSRRPQRGAVRRHRPRQDPPGLAAPGARDGHLVAPHRGMVDGAEHHGGAGRRRPEDGTG